MDSKATCLERFHEAQHARLIDFASWRLPVQFEGILAEHSHCRNACSVFDTCHMGQFRTSGPGAAEFLSRLLTRDARRQSVGSSWYGLLLNEQAGIIDDTILMRLGPEDFLLVVNAATKEGDLAWLRDHLMGQVRLADQADWAKIDVQGPASGAVMNGLLDFPLEQLDYFHCRTARCMGRQCVISRSGYTGELGYEIFMPCGDLVALYEHLLSNPHVRPAGLGARDLLRLEMCYPLYGQDITLQTNPIEADLGHFIRTDHDFIGRQAVEQIQRQGVVRKLIAFVSESRARPEKGSTILVSAAPVGTVTSGSFSPSLGTSIGMGYVHISAASESGRLLIDTGKRTLEAVIQSKPLYKRGTCRAQNVGPETTHGS